jgi:hypothetical protein
MRNQSLGDPEVSVREDWELQVRAYLEMCAPDERADTLARIKRLIAEWEEESGLDTLKHQAN